MRTHPSKQSHLVRLLLLLLRSNTHFFAAFRAPNSLQAVAMKMLLTLCVSALLTATVTAAEPALLWSSERVRIDHTIDPSAWNVRDVELGTKDTKNKVEMLYGKVTARVDMKNEAVFKLVDKEDVTNGTALVLRVVLVL